MVIRGESHDHHRTARTFCRPGDPNGQFQTPLLADDFGRLSTVGYTLPQPIMVSNAAQTPQEPNDRVPTPDLRLGTPTATCLI